MGLNVTFVSVHELENEFYSLVETHLRMTGAVSTFVTLSRKATRDKSRVGAPVTCIRDILAPAPARRDLERVVDEVEEKYGRPGLRQVCIADRGVREWGETDALSYAVRYFPAWERYLDEVRPDVVVSDWGPELIRRTMYLVCRAKGIPCVFMCWLPFPNKLVLSSEERRILDTLSPERIRPLTRAEKDEVERYVTWYKGKATAWVFNPPPVITLPRIGKFVRDSFVSAFVEHGEHEHLRKSRHALTLGMRIVRKNAAKILYRKPPLSGKFIFFPLHAPDDFQLTVRAPHLLDQRYVAATVADAIPYGYSLVVKEHPAAIGEERFSRLLALSRKPNVVLVPPSTNTHLLIRHAALVVTINSTAGFEALLYGKPVLTLEDSFYSGMGLTYDVRTLEGLPAAIRDSLDARPDARRVLEFIHAAMGCTYPGTSLSDTSSENAARVASSLVRKFEEIGVTRKSGASVA